MLIPSTKNPTDCFYCHDIHHCEKDYPLRKGKYSFEGLVSRCLWHSKFKCSECDKYRHFSYLYWCPTSNKIICGNCNNAGFHPVQFWNKTYAYAFNCKHCGEIHYDLLYAEYMGKHPWQVNKKILYKEGSPLIPVINTYHAWNPIWKPRESRIGKELTSEEALKVENIVHRLWKENSNVTLHSDVTSEEQVDLRDTKSKWNKTSQVLINYYERSDEDKGDSNREFIIDPALWEQIGNVKGLKVLDAGCGNGYLTRQLARKGAEAVGVDFSKQFIGYCKKREKEDPIGCNFYCGSLTDMSFFEYELFDIVVSNIVMIDVQDYKTAFKEISRVLKPNGKFIWSNLHPVFGSINQLFYRLPLDTPRNEERLCSMIDRYFDSGAILMSWGSMKPIWQFHRTLQEYTQALNKAGFLISEIVEPKPSLEDIENNPRTLALMLIEYPSL